MIADCGDVGAIFRYPRTCGNCGIEEKQTVANNGSSVKTELGSKNAFRGRCVENCSVCHRCELNTADFVKNYIINAVGKIGACDSV